MELKRNSHLMMKAEKKSFQVKRHYWKLITQRVSQHFNSTRFCAACCEQFMWLFYYNTFFLLIFFISPLKIKVFLFDVFGNCWEHRNEKMMLTYSTAVLMKWLLNLFEIWNLNEIAYVLLALCKKFINYTAWRLLILRG